MSGLDAPEPADAGIASVSAVASGEELVALALGGDGKARRVLLERLASVWARLAAGRPGTAVDLSAPTLEALGERLDAALVTCEGHYGRLCCEFFAAFGPLPWPVPLPKRWSQRRRSVVAAVLGGEDLGAIATRLGLSPAQVRAELAAAAADSGGDDDDNEVDSP